MSNGSSLFSLGRFAALELLVGAKFRKRIQLCTNKWDAADLLAVCPPPYLSPRRHPSSVHSNVPFTSPQCSHAFNQLSKNGA